MLFVSVDGKIKMNNQRVIILLLLFIFFISLPIFASEVTFLPLEETIENGTLIVQAKLNKIESKKEPNYYIQFFTVSDIKVINGSMIDNIKMFIHKRVIPVIYDKNGKEVGSFSPILKDSGIEYSLENGKTYLFFAEIQNIENGTLTIFRVEPEESKLKVLNLLNKLKNKH